MAQTSVELSNALDVIRRLQIGSGSNGTPLAPRTTGDSSVPSVSGVVASGITQTATATVCTLTWNEPVDTRIVSYRVWATNLINSNASPLFVGEFSHAPAQVSVTGNLNSAIVLAVQTVLNNGLVNQLSNCPTVSIAVTAPTVTGFAVQTPANVTITNPVIPFALTGPSSLPPVSILSVSETCSLLAVRVAVTTPWTVTGGASPSGNIDVFLQITVDGAAPQTLRLFNTFPSGASAGPEPFHSDIETFSTTGTGDGSHAGDIVVASFNISCSESLAVDVIITTDAASGTTASRTLTGSVTINCGYAVKTG